MVNSWNKTFFLLLFIFVSSTNLFAQGQSDKQTSTIKYPDNYYIIKDLSDQWQVYDEKYKAYVPYFNERHKNPKTASFWLALDKYSTYDLVFLSPREKTYFFIQNGLIKKLAPNVWNSLSIDSLRSKYQQNKIFCTLYTFSSFTPGNNIFIGQKKLSQVAKIKEEKKEGWYQEKVKKSSVLNSFLVILFFLVLIYMTFLIRVYFVELQEYFSISYARYRNDELGAVLKPFQSSYILVLFGQVLIITCFYLIAQKGNLSLISIDPTFLYKSQTVYALVFNLFILLVFVMFIVAVKYLLIWIASNVLSIDGISNIHFYEYLRLSYLFYTFMIALVLLIYLGINPIFPFIADKISFIVFFFHISQAIVTSIVITRKVDFKNIYLFYYLCITELIPILIGIKIFLFS